MHVHPHPPGERPVDTADLASGLRARGMRVTPQREQVLGAVRRLGHATPEQVCEAVDGVDLATVYRNLDLLEELGYVRHTHLGHGAPFYRPAEDDHTHIVCHRCGAVVDVPAAVVDDLSQRLRTERDFELDRSHLTIFGRCADCAAAEQTAPATR